ncbi:MAG: amino acid adenylation domain-containing protein [Polyangiales bacterium]
MSNRAGGAAPPQLTAVEFDPFAAPELARTHASTEAQRELWTAAQISDDASRAFNESVHLRLEGALDASALAASVQDLVARHEALRTTFSADGLTACVAASLALPLGRIDLSQLPQREREAKLRALLVREVETPFALEQGPLFRVQLVKLGPSTHVASFSAHHIVCDGWSMAVMLRDLGALYSTRVGKPAALPAATQFGDYARQEQTYEQTPEYQKSLMYWLDRLGGSLPVLELPLDAPRPSAKTYASRRIDHALDDALVPALKKLGARHGASFFATLLSGFYVLLARLSDQEDTIVGIPAAGQSVTDQPELVGHCVNTLPLRVQVEESRTLAELLKTVKRTVLDAYDHQRCTFGSVLRRLSLQRDPSRLPGMSVLFNLDQAPTGASFGFADLSVDYASNPRSFENFELFINAAESAGHVVLECQYNSDLFSAETVQRWLASYEQLLRSMLDGDGRSLAELSIVPPEARATLLSAWNQTDAPFPRDLTVHQLFAEAAAGHPEKVAVIAGGTRVRYRELAERASRLAAVLRAEGVRRDVLVGLCASRTPDLLVGMLAILEAGGAYVPLDPAFPRERLAFMLEDAALPVLVTEQKLADNLPPHGARIVLLDHAPRELREAPSPRAASDDDARAESLAYVIYTSGSTGKPKGVCVPQRAAVNFLTSMAREPGLDVHDVLLAVTTLSFDIHVLELLLPLTVGATVVLATREMAVDGALLREQIEEHAVTTMQATPSTFRLLLGAGFRGDARFKVLVGGEALPRDLAAELTRAAGSVWNMYGPTETTVWSTCWRVPSAPSRISIGRPIQNTRVYVLDKRMQPVPVGVPGELHIGGEGVTRGYLNRPELTAERFVRDPFSERPDARLYKTGDLVRLLPDGLLEYLRRNDNQVKLRGYRIELGEIEAALSGAPGVRQAVVALREPRPGDVRLVGYVVADPARAPSETSLRQHVRASLPEYMTPQHIVTLPALPLTPNGKIDRRALPAPSLEAGFTDGAYVAPRTREEAMVAKVFEDVLGARQVSVEDDFFALGGHSLLAAQALIRLSAEHGVQLPLRQLFENPSAARLGRVISGGDAGAPPAPPPLRIPRRDDDGPAPLSLMQQRLWVLEQFDPGLAVQNLPSAFRIRGALNLDAFGRALSEVTRRHEAIRTTLHWQGEQAVQKVRPELHFDLTPIDLSNLPVPEREASLLERLRADAAKPFDLTEGPLVRAALYRLGPDEHVFFWLPHHAIWDGWSFDVFLAEMDALYGAFTQGEPSPLPSLPIRYRDFAAWHERWLAGEELGRQLDYWKKQLAGELPLLAMPTDRPRPARLSYRGATEQFVLSKAEVDALTQLGRRSQATLYMVLLAGFKLMLSRYTAQDDVLVGTPVRGRSMPETENLLGFFVNTLVLRTDVAGAPSFVELLGRVRATVLDAFSHQEMPFELLVQALNVQRDSSRTPVFQAFFTFQDVSNRAPRFGALSYAQIHVHAPVAPTDLYLWVKETGNGLVGGIDYLTDLFDRETMVRFLRQFRHLLLSACDKPTHPIVDLSILPDAERAAVLAVNATDAPYPRERGVHALVEERAAATPDAIAAVCDGKTLSYGALVRNASALAARLSAAGVGPGSLVGVHVSRSLALLETILGVLQAGAGYVPLDPAFPRDRLAFMVDDAGLSAIVSEQALAGELPPHAAKLVLIDAPEAPAPATPTPTTRVAGEAPAYVIYTSGSTGKPKGVVVPHRAVVNFLTSVAQQPGLAAHETLLAVTTLSFDIHVLELWLPLVQGAKVVIATRDESVDGDRLLGLLRETRASVLQATPATYRLLLAAGLRTGDVSRALIGGEALPRELAAQLAERVDTLWNMYGPTETTVWSTCQVIPKQPERIAIGRPLANTRVYVRDRHGQLCPFGVPGELYIGGDGVALGYLGRPELTAERFVREPAVDPGPLYKTGDLVRMLDDGALEYQRRNDHQVKLRGYRIELGEIEAALAQHPGVAQTVAQVREDTPGDARLVAYVVAKKGDEATDSELRAHLRVSLPDYMLPQHFVTLAALPLTPNGKVDRKALPPPFVRDDADAYVAPSTPSELLLARIWSEVLGVSRVSAHDNFFNIGGHSLLSLQVIAKLAQATGQRIGPNVLLLNSLAQVAAQLPGASPAPGDLPSTPPANDTTRQGGLLGRILGRVKEKLRSS